MHSINFKDVEILILKLDDFRKIHLAYYEFIYIFSKYHIILLKT